MNPANQERVIICYCEHAPEGHAICLDCGDDIEDCVCVPVGEPK